LIKHFSIEVITIFWPESKTKKIFIITLLDHFSILIDFCYVVKFNSIFDLKLTFFWIPESSRRIIPTHWNCESKLVDVGTMSPNHSIKLHILRVPFLANDALVTIRVL